MRLHLLAALVLLGCSGQLDVAPPPDTPFAGGGHLPVVTAATAGPPRPSPAASPSPVALPTASPPPSLLPYARNCPAGTPTDHPCVVVSALPGGGVAASVGANAVGDMTIGFGVTGQNLRVTGLHDLVTVKRGQLVPVATIEAFDPAQTWNYEWSFHFVRGDAAANADGTLYRLPFARGTTHKVVQGWNGSFSHQGIDAIDWEMPVGTLVLAARGGLVVETRADATEAGLDPARKDTYPVNAVYIRHDDGTVGAYLHLDHDGVLVRPGQRVTTGEPIARSGNTGYSQGPHLHFEVQAPKDAQSFRTFPVLFQTRSDTTTGEQPLEGRAYTAF